MVVSSDVGRFIETFVYDCGRYLLENEIDELPEGIFDGLTKLLSL